jgi:ribosomal protein S18 acetylase RimI-like enzyme
MLIEIPKNNIQEGKIIIRQAKPIPEEGLQYAKFLNEASEGFFQSMLGNATYDIISEAYVKTNNDYSYENTYFIEYDNSIVGMISGYSKPQKDGFDDKILKRSVAGSKIKIKIFSITGRILSHFIGPKSNDEYYIQAIAISSDMRGVGLGQKLLNYIERFCLENGCSVLSLDVSSKNTTAIKAYNKFGMKVSSYWPNFLKLPPVFTRMEKQLMDF